MIYILSPSYEIYSLSNADEMAVQPVVTEDPGVMVASVGSSAREVIDPVDVAAGTIVTDVSVTMLLEMIIPDGSLVTS